MNLYTNIPEADTYLQERLGNLPPELVSAVQDDSLFQKIYVLLSAHNIDNETIELIQHEVLLILMRILPKDELASTLVAEYSMNIVTAISVAQEIEATVLSPYEPLLTDLSDDEQGNVPSNTISNGAPATIRTMEGDAQLQNQEAEPIVQSVSQDDILRGNRVAEVPSYSTPEEITPPTESTPEQPPRPTAGPRWESDTV